MYKLITIFILQLFLINSINLWALGIQGLHTKGMDKYIQDEMHSRLEKKHSDIKTSNISRIEEKNEKIFLQINNKKYELDKYYFNEHATKIEIKKENIKKEIEELLNKDYKLSLIGKKAVIRRKLGLQGGGIRNKADLEKYWQSILNDEDSKTAVKASENILLNMTSHQSSLIEPLWKLESIDPRKVDEPYTVFLNLIEALANKRALTKKTVIIRKIAMFAQQYLYMSYLTIGRDGKADITDIKESLALLKKRYKKSRQSGIYHEVLLMSWEVEFLNTFRDETDCTEEFVKLGKNIAFAVKDIGSFIAWNHEEIAKTITALTNSGIKAGTMIGTLGMAGNFPIDEIFKVFSSVYKIASNAVTKIVKKKKFKTYMNYDKESRNVIDSKEEIDVFLKNTSFKTLSLIKADWVLVHKVVECLYFIILCSRSDTVKRSAFNELKQFVKFKEFVWTNNWRIRQKASECLIYLANLQREDSYKYEKDELSSIIEEASNLLESREKYEKDVRVKYILESPIETLAVLEKLNKVDAVEFIEKQDKEEQQVALILKDLWDEQKGNFESVISDLSYIKSNLVTKEEFEKANENYDKLEDKIDELMFYQKILEEKHEKEFEQISSCLKKAEAVQDKMLNILVNVEKTVKKLDEGQKEILKEIREYKESKDLRKRIIVNRRKVWKDKKNEQLYKEIQDLYIDLRCKQDKSDSDDKNFDLTYQVDKFLAGKNKVLFLTGNVGIGKSMFLKRLDKNLCEAWTQGEYIPVYVNLASLKDPVKKLIGEGLKNLGIASKNKILLHNKKFLFLLDGHDEMRQNYRKKSLYQSNLFNKFKNSKVIITCREEYVNDKLQRRLMPKNISEKKYIMPLNKNQRNQYLKRYIEKNKTNWNLNNYLNYIKIFRGLEELSLRPLTLHMIATVLPEIIKNSKEKDRSSLRISRRKLYKIFMDEYFYREWDKIVIEAEIDDFFEEDFENCAIVLALEMHKKGINEMIYLTKETKKHKKGDYSSSDEDIEEKVQFEKKEIFWDDIFEDVESKKKITKYRLFHVLPLRTNKENIYSFFHDTLIDYFTNRKLEKLIGQQSKLHVSEFIEILKPKIVSQSMIDFMVDSIEEVPRYKEVLFKIIEKSKKYKNIGYAASNAITALNAAGTSFSGMDLSDINIPEANLSNVIMDSTILRRANLLKVNFMEAWLNNVDLSNSNMKEVIFGERACLNIKRKKIKSIIYLPKIFSFIYSCSDNTVSIWNIKTSIEIGPFPIGTIESIMDLEEEDTFLFRLPRGTIVLLSKKTGKSKIIKAYEHNFYNLLYIKEKGLIATTKGRGKNFFNRKIKGDKVIRLWDIKTGKEKYRLEGHDKNIEDMFYIVEHSLLVSSSEDKTIRLWDIKTGKEKYRLEGHKKAIDTMFYIAKHNLLASKSQDETIRLWNIKTGKEKIKLKYKTCSLDKSTFLKDIKDQDLLAIENANENICLYDIKTSKILKLEGNLDGIERMKYISKHDLLLATGSCLDPRIHLWDIKTGKRKLLKGLRDTIISLIYIDKYDLVVASSIDYSNNVKIWDIKTGKEKLTLKRHGSGVISKLTYISKFDLLAGGNGNTIYLWDIKTGKLKLKLRGHTGDIDKITYIPEDDLLISESRNDQIRFWDIKKMVKNPKIGKYQDMSDFKYISGLNLIASKSINNKSIVYLWDIKTKQKKVALEKYKGNLNNLVYIEEANLLVNTDYNNIIHLWDIKTGKEKFKLKGHTRSIQNLIYISKYKLLVSSGFDGTIRFWDMDRYIEKKKIKVYATSNYTTGIVYFRGEGDNYKEKDTAEVITLIYIPHKDLLVSGNLDTTIRFWDIKTGEEKFKIKAKIGAASCSTYITKKDLFAMGNRDNTISLRDIKTGKEKQKFQGHTESVSSLTYLSKLGLLASGSRDCTIRFWDIETGKEKFKIQGHTNEIYDLKYIAKDNLLVSQSLDQSIKVWDLTLLFKIGRPVLKYNITKNSALFLENITIKGVKGLSDNNKELLMQRGAIVTSS